MINECEDFIYLQFEKLQNLIFLKNGIIYFCFKLHLAILIKNKIIMIFIYILNSFISNSNISTKSLIHISLLIFRKTSKTEVFLSKANIFSDLFPAFSVQACVDFFTICPRNLLMKLYNKGWAFHWILSYFLKQRRYIIIFQVHNKPFKNPESWNWVVNTMLMKIFRRFLAKVHWDIHSLTEGLG